MGAVSTRFERGRIFLIARVSRPNVSKDEKTALEQRRMEAPHPQMNSRIDDLVNDRSYVLLQGDPTRKWIHWNIIPREQISPPLCGLAKIRNLNLQ